MLLDALVAAATRLFRWRGALWALALAGGAVFGVSLFAEPAARSLPLAGLLCLIWASSLAAAIQIFANRDWTSRRRPPTLFARMKRTVAIAGAWCLVVVTLVVALAALALTLRALSAL